MTGLKSQLIYKPPDRRPEAASTDITRARTLLNWEPKVMLDEGSSRRLALQKRRSGNRKQAGRAGREGGWFRTG